MFGNNMNYPFFMGNGNYWDKMMPPMPDGYPGFQLMSGINILDMKRGDVNGDGCIDTVFLTGKQIEDAAAVEDIQLMIRDGMTGYFTIYPLEFNIGYDPELYLADFNGDNIEDIFIGIPTGGSGGMVYYYLYSYAGNRLTPLFNAEEMNAGLKATVDYQDYYKVSVKVLDEEFIIDVSQRKDYYDDIYDENGKLIKPVSGFVGGVVQMIPSATDFDKPMNIVALQKIAGTSNADSLGYLYVLYEYNEDKFEIDRINILI